MVAAMLLRDLICGVENPHRKLFSPQRVHPLASAGAWAVDMGESAMGLTKGVIYGLDRKQSTHRCRHLGCGLSWNEDEQTWDCPCHGSRFDEKGTLLSDPATGDLKRK